jgi:hypothetical protein
MLALMGSRYRSLYRFDCIFRTRIAAVEINVFSFHVFLTDRYMHTTYVIKLQVSHGCQLRLTVYAHEITGDYERRFRCNRPTANQMLYMGQILKKKRDCCTARHLFITLKESEQ